MSQIMTRFFSDFAEYRLQHPAFAENMVNDSTLLPKVPKDLSSALPKLQNRLTHVLHEMSCTALLGKVSVSMQAQIKSQQQQGASSVFDAIPSCPELTISNEAYAHFLKSYQCIMELDFPMAVCTCAVGYAGARGVPHAVACSHLVFCPLGGGTTLRHDHVCHMLAQVMRMAGIHVHGQYQTQDRNLPEEEKQFPDFLLSNCPGPGQHSCADFSVICERQSRRVLQAAQNPLSAATVREFEKRVKYTPYAAADQRVFISLVMESTGAFGKELQGVLRYCAENVNQASFAETEDQRTWASAKFSCFARQSLAIAFWQGSYQMSKAQARARAASTAIDAAAADGHPRASFIPRPRLSGFDRSRSRSSPRQGAPPQVMSPRVPSGGAPFTPPSPRAV